MYSALNRINALAAFTLSTLTVLTFLCYASTAFNDSSRPATINAATVVLKNVPDYVVSREKNDLGVLRFDLNADLTPVFNWNVKQLFVYLVAEYASEKNNINQVVLWDHIMRHDVDSPVLKLKNENLKYYFWDDGHGLLGNKNVTLKLEWNIIPNAGQLPLWSSTGSFKLAFPDKYSSVHQ
ncbi:Signal peptidase complex subunit 3 [Trinorchestia longiramus]|nr:Signal peptidase complex subunit 3 [Trinorchestia longiramus]